MTNHEKINVFLNRARNWCSRRELCISDIKSRLLKFDMMESEMQTIIDILVSEKYIDESRYVNAFVHDKINFQKWGIQKIKQALYYKGISRNEIDEVLENINKEEYLEKFLPVALNRKKTIKGLDDFEKNQKLIRFLLSKGINMDDVFRILEKIKEEK
jgi:regulatory protein